MSLKIIGRIIVVISAVTAVFLQLYSKLLVSQSPSHVLSRTTSKAMDGSALYSTSVVGYSNVIHWNIIIPLSVFFFFGVFCTWLARRRP